MKRLAVIILAVGLVFIGIQESKATITAKTAYSDRTSTYDGGFVYFTHTFAATADTLSMPFTVGRKRNAGVTSPLTLMIETAGADADGDSMSICVRVLESWDNVNWQIFTIGTDSTTWVTTYTGLTTDAVTGGYKTQVFPLAVATYGGWMPYYKLWIFRKSTYNKAGVKFKAAILEQ
jgi:hypothetical protein